MIRTSLLAALALLASLSACATGASTRDAESRALYQAHAGAPVDKFRYQGRMTRWTPLGDESLVVWTRPTEAWLLDLSGPCQDLSSTPAISLTSSVGVVSARFDKVLVASRSPVNMPCHIDRIRPLDVKALKADERGRREARKRGQPSGT